MAKYKERLQEVDAEQVPDQLKVNEKWRDFMVQHDTIGLHVGVNGQIARPGDYVVNDRFVYTKDEFNKLYEPVGKK